MLKLWQVRRSSLAMALVFNSCQLGCSFELEPSLAACLGSVLEVPVWWWKSCRLPICRARLQKTATCQPAKFQYPGKGSCHLLAGNCGMLRWASNQVSRFPCSVGALADRAPKFVLQTGLCWNFCLNSLVCSSVLLQLVADWIGNFATSRSVVWQPCLGSLAVLG